MKEPIDLDIKFVKDVMRIMGINKKFITPKMLKYAIEVEHEHKDITGDNLGKTLHIIDAHLNEYPDYYKRLMRMEKAASKYWKNRPREPLYI